MDSTSLNKNIISQFKHLITQVSREKPDNYTFKINAYKKVISTLESIDFKITLDNYTKLSTYDGIGSKSIEKIHQILTNGKITSLKTTNEPDDDISTIHGIGEKLKTKLINHGYNLQSILYHMSGAGSIEKRQELLALLPQSSITYIKYYNDVTKKIPREEISNIGKLIRKTIFKHDKTYKMEICGSYRRQLPFSSDIDIVLTSGSGLSKIVKHLKHSNIIVDSLTSDDTSTKFMGIVKLDNKSKAHRIDIRYVDEESYITSVLYFTGSKEFNVKMRTHAKQMGYTLNEYGLYENGKKINVESEEEIFSILNMEYVKPKKR